MLMRGKYFNRLSIVLSFLFSFSSVMYRKYREHKDKEYETIIRRQVNESKLVAEQEGVSIPKTLEDYVAPSRIDTTGTKNGKMMTLSSLSHGADDDIEIEVRF